MAADHERNCGHTSGHTADTWGHTCGHTADTVDIVDTCGHLGTPADTWGHTCGHTKDIQRTHEGHEGHKGTKDTKDTLGTNEGHTADTQRTNEGQTKDTRRTKITTVFFKSWKILKIYYFFILFTLTPFWQTHFSTFQLIGYSPPSIPRQAISGWRAGGWSSWGTGLGSGSCLLMLLMFCWWGIHCFMYWL